MAFICIPVTVTTTPRHTPPVVCVQSRAAYFTTLPLIIIVMNSLALRRASSTGRALLALRRPAHRALSTQKDPQLGDYPALPDVSRATLPPTGWWDNQMRRNFGDTVSLSPLPSPHLMLCHAMLCHAMSCYVML